MSQATEPTVWGAIDGRTITFPMEVNDFDAATLVFSVPALAALVRDAAAGRRTVSRRHIATGDTSGGPSHLGVTLSPWSGGPGEGGVICLFTDLSRVVALEEQLRLKDALARLGCDENRPRR